MASQKVRSPALRRDRAMLDVPHVRLRLRDTTAPWISNFLRNYPVAATPPLAMELWPGAVISRVRLRCPVQDGQDSRRLGGGHGCPPRMSESTALGHNGGASCWIVTIVVTFQFGCTMHRRCSPVSCFRSLSAGKSARTDLKSIPEQLELAFEGIDGGSCRDGCSRGSACVADCGYAAAFPSVLRP